MESVSVSLVWTVSFVLGVLITYVALALGCFFAIEATGGRRLPYVAIVSQSISTIPRLVATILGVKLPVWALFLSWALSIAVIVPLLVYWGGFDLAKAIHVTLLASLLILAFNALVIG